VRPAIRFPRQVSIASIRPRPVAIRRRRRSHSARLCAPAQTESACIFFLAVQQLRRLLDDGLVGPVVTARGAARMRADRHIRIARNDLTKPSFPVSPPFASLSLVDSRGDDMTRGVIDDWFARPGSACLALRYSDEMGVLLDITPGSTAEPWLGLDGDSAACLMNGDPQARPPAGSTSDEPVGKDAR